MDLCECTEEPQHAMPWKLLLKWSHLTPPCVTSHPAGAFRDHLHLRPLRFCQLQLARDCDWRPVWVFDHSFTTWCYCFLGKARLKCFLSHQASICPPRRGDISSMVLRAMITGTCVSLVNACIAGKRFSKTSGSRASLHSPQNPSEVTNYPETLNLFSIELVLQGILFLPPLDCVALFSGLNFNTTNSDVMTCCADLFQK